MKDPVSIVQEAGWAPGPVWTGAENYAPTEIRSQDRPALSQSLYRLSYPAYLLDIYWNIFTMHGPINVKDTNIISVVLTGNTFKASNR
jgi:hypothetical protein